MSQFTDYTHLLALLKQAYGLEFTAINPPQSGYRNLNYKLLTKTGAAYNLIIYKQEPEILQRIKQANYVSDHLSAAGFSTRATITAVNSQKLLVLNSGQAKRYACLYNFLPGETIPWEGYTQKHIKLLGQTLGALHHTLAKLKLPAGYTAARTELNNQLAQLEMYFKQSGVIKAMRIKLGLQLEGNLYPGLSHLLNSASLKQKPLALHLDFVRSNILFSGRGESLHISGILDFEKTAQGPVVLDLARSLAFLIVDCKYKPEVKVRKYFLQSGYVKRGGGSLPPESQLNAWLDYFWLYDFYKFLRHNPYESLRENEHYQRTVKKLLEQRLVVPV